MKNIEEKTVGETVRFDRDLHIGFNPELIDFLEVYNPSKKKFVKCEHWGDEQCKDGVNETYDFGSIGDFHFETTPTETRLFYGDPPKYGFMRDQHHNLILLPVASKVPEGFFIEAHLWMDLKFPAAKTMWDFAMHIDTFLSKRLSKISELQMTHAQKVAEWAKPSPKSNFCETDDLPF